MDRGIWTGDTESDGFLELATVIHCAVFKNLDTGMIVTFTPDTIHTLGRWMDDTVKMVVGHNFIKHDLPLIKKILGYEYTGKVYDTLILSRILSPHRRVPRNCPNPKASPHGLEAWGYRVGRGKPEHNDWSTFTPMMLHRCTEDVEINELTYLSLQDEMEDGDWSRAVPMTMKLFEVFNKIEAYGWKVDQDWMQKCIITLNAEFHTIDAYLEPMLPYLLVVDKKSTLVREPFLKSGKYNQHMEKWFLDTSKDSHEAIDRYYDREVGGPFCRILYRKVDVTKRVEMIDLLLADGWIPDEWNFNKETKERTSPKLSYKDKFIGIESDMGKMAARRVQVRHRHSLINGLFKLIRPDGRIGSRITGLAETSRVKHSGIVNVPNADSYFGKEIRKIFVAEDDKILVGVDSVSNQIRQLSARMGDDEYTHRILTEDPHDVNQDIAKLDTRGHAKTVFYGFVFGAGDAKVGAEIGGDAKAGKRLKQKFLDGLPMLKALIERLKEEWRSHASTRKGRWGVEFYNGWIAGLDGRPVYIKSEHAILVYVLQNMEAIQMSYALLFTYKWLEEAGLKWGDDYGIVCFYHDEINTECKPEHKELVGETVKRAIKHAGEYLGIKTPHDGDIKIGSNWFAIH